jgi:hypothetical protein
MVSTPRPDRTTTRRRGRAALLAAALLALVMPACGSSSPTLPDVYIAVVQVTVEPNPVIGSQNPLTGAVSASYRIDIQELNGLGGEVQFVSSTIFDPATGQQLALNYFDSNDLTVFVGTKRLEAKGTLLVPQTIAYTLPDLTKATNVTVSVQVRDDRQNLITRSLLVPIQ